jgi:hypothetical protein
MTPGSGLTPRSKEHSDGKVIAARPGENGDGDVVLVHSQPDEEKFVADGPSLTGSSVQRDRQPSQLQDRWAAALLSERSSTELIPGGRPSC